GSSRPRGPKPPKRLPRLLRPNRKRGRTQRHPLLRQHRRRHPRPLPAALISHEEAQAAHLRFVLFCGDKVVGTPYASVYLRITPFTSTIRPKCAGICLFLGPG